MALPATRLAPTARNAAILRAVRGELAATLTTASRESAIRRIEAAAEALPERPGASRVRSRSVRRIGTLVGALDATAASGAWLVSRGPHDVLVFTLSALAVIVACSRADLYRSRLELTVLDDLAACLLAAVVGVLTSAGVDSLRGADGSSTETYVAFGAALFAMLVLSRALAYPVIRGMRRSRLIAHPVVIVGTGTIGQRLAAELRARPEYGLTPIGFADFEATTLPRSPSILPILGDVGDLPEIAAELDAQHIVFAFSRQADAHMVRIVRGCVRLGLRVFVVPRYFELCGTDRRARIETISGIPLMRLQRPLRAGTSKWR